MLQWDKSFHLDELSEFNRNVLEVLRQPLEDRVITISRIKYSTEYPALFMLVALMNLVPAPYQTNWKNKASTGTIIIKTTD